MARLSDAPDQGMTSNRHLAKVGLVRPPAERIPRDLASAANGRRQERDRGINATAEWLVRAETVGRLCGEKNYLLRRRMTAMIPKRHDTAFAKPAQNPFIANC